MINECQLLKNVKDNKIWCKTWKNEEKDVKRVKMT
jgi:hypothetical protein